LEVTNAAGVSAGGSLPLPSVVVEVQG
jgi:hypothetical protein